MHLHIRMKIYMAARVVLANNNNNNIITRSRAQSKISRKNNGEMRNRDLCEFIEYIKASESRPNHNAF